MSYLPFLEYIPFHGQSLTFELDQASGGRSNSNLSTYRGDEAAVSRFAEEALQLARRLEDENVLAYVLLRASWAYGETGNTAKTAPHLFE